MKKFLALLLAVIMLLSMVACAEVENKKDDDDEETTTEEKESKTEEKETKEDNKTADKKPVSPVVGTWEFKADFGPQLKATYESSASTAVYSPFMDYTNMKARLIEFEFAADGKVTLTPSSKLKDDIDDLGMVIAEGMEKYVKDATGKSMKEATGMTVEEYAEAMASSFNLDYLEMDAEEGTWELKGDEIILTSEDGEEMIAKFDEAKEQMTLELPGMEDYELIGEKK